MRLCSRLLAIVMFVLIYAATSAAQSSASTSQSIETLRNQLRDVQAREVELQQRLKQIEESLRPENIERSLALTGSTRPEELREQRRRQLETERANVRSQLEQLGASRTRLETTIAALEAEAYRQSALPQTTGPPTQSETSSSQQEIRPAQTSRTQRTRRRQRARRARTRRRG